MHHSLKTNKKIKIKTNETDTLEILIIFYLVEIQRKKILTLIIRSFTGVSHDSLPW